MATRREYLDFVLEQLSGTEGVTARQMMGEYILYIHGRVLGGVYDDRLLVKPTPSARALMPDAPLEEPYPGAKEMLLVERMDDRDFLCRLAQAMYPELPEPRHKGK